MIGRPNPTTSPIGWCLKFNLQFPLFYREKLYFEAGVKMDDFKAIDDQFLLG
jgi:hypothetical protein